MHRPGGSTTDGAVASQICSINVENMGFNSRQQSLLHNVPFTVVIILTIQFIKRLMSKSMSKVNEFNQFI